MNFENSKLEKSVLVIEKNFLTSRLKAKKDHNDNLPIQTVNGQNNF